MSKELEALKQVNELINNVEEYKNKTGKDNPTICMSEKLLISIQNALQPALQRLEAIDNVNPSEALMELEVLKDILNEFLKNNLIDKAFTTIKATLLKAQEQEKVLKEVKADLTIELNNKKNANPSEAITYVNQFINEMTKCLENPKQYAKNYDKQIFYKYEYTFETVIKQALIKAQEQEKVLKIIKEKGLDYHSLSAIKQAKDFEEFKELTKNLITKYLDYTQEEFDLLKRYANE